MLSRQLGFMSSWKMLTRDKGWLKPLLVLTLVSWIPILGQIAVLGYGLEWARLTAWGVDSAPKQRGVNYGKILSTGGIALLLTITMSIVVGIIDFLLFGTAVVGAAFPLSAGLSTLSNMTGTASAYGGISLVSMLLMAVVNIFFGTIMSAAMMRATLYDGFGAGWRVDRLVQMAGRDFGGFLHTYAVSLIGGLIVGAVSAVVTLVGILLLAAGGLWVAGAGYAGYLEYDLAHALLNIGALPILLIVLLGIVALFAVQVVGVAMQLVSMNAMGQWFCRFEVNRWGVSSAPLPDDVPNRSASWAAAAGTPTNPDISAVSSAQGYAQQQAPVSPQQPVQPVAGDATCAPAQVTPADWQQGSGQAPDAGQPVAEQSVPAAPDDAAAPQTAVPDVSVQQPVAEQDAASPAAEEKSIPLAPIARDDATGEDEGPIQA